MSLILGLETSCDETAAALVADGRIVRANVVATQHELHETYRGVVPEIASRAHLEKLLPVVEATVRDGGASLGDLDAIAVGNRPGLIGSLIVGVSAAKALAWTLAKPIIGVDHVAAHLYAALLQGGEDVTREDHTIDAQTVYPALGLVVSGGHTSLYDVHGPLERKLIGHTIDDAVGEAYDKAAVILGLGYPGGPEIDKLAASGDEKAHQLPRSLLKPGSLDFSFSGLKTALLYTVRGQPRKENGQTVFDRDENDLSDAARADLAASFQAAAVGVVITKIRRAIRQARDRGEPYRSLIVGGGVSANSRLRADAAALAEKEDIHLLLPAFAYCLDNAAMIAGLGHHRLMAGDCDSLDLPARATASA